jgi:hypothetical protein
MASGATVAFVMGAIKCGYHHLNMLNRGRLLGLRLEVVVLERLHFGQLRERFVRAREEGDLAPDNDPTALAKFVSAVIAGMGVLATSGSDREELRRVAVVAVKAFDKKSVRLKQRDRRGGSHDRTDHAGRVTAAAP